MGSLLGGVLGQPQPRLWVSLEGESWLTFPPGDPGGGSVLWHPQRPLRAPSPQRKNQQGRHVAASGLEVTSELTALGRAGAPVPHFSLLLPAEPRVPPDAVDRATERPPGTFPFTCPEVLWSGCAQTLVTAWPGWVSRGPSCSHGCLLKAQPEFGRNILSVQMGSAFHALPRPRCPEDVLYIPGLPLWSEFLSF